MDEIKSALLFKHNDVLSPFILRLCEVPFELAFLKCWKNLNSDSDLPIVLLQVLNKTSFEKSNMQSQYIPA